ncbi:MAG: thiamine pyrophosphate-dependent dehydrogenase E1 component subunit alpha [Planctomycetota bacterium]|jgi:pyruvate dehydrogenase E1 component alpha subunit
MRDRTGQLAPDTGRLAEDLYRTLSLIRHLELKIVEVYPTDVMQTPVHLSIGQESLATALCAHLRDDDLKIGTHRSHALYLANGGDPAALLAELLGRTTGCSGGWGGSMHVIDPARGLVGTSSIVGGAVVIAVGLAMAVERPRIAAAYFGDGAADQGVFAESLNFAALKRLPVVFLCANNRYSVYTPASQRRAVPPAEVARGFGVRTIEAPIEVASDVVALHELLAEPIADVRAGAGPLMAECHTVRALDHNGIRDDVAAGFRPQVEHELFETYDPVKIARRRLPDERVERIDAEMSEAVEAAYARALEGDPPGAESAGGCWRKEVADE